jgi:isopentenyl phosphate kinase
MHARQQAALLRGLGLALPAALALRRLLSWLLRPPACRIVIKLGGSACTDKASFETVDEACLERTAQQLAQTRAAAGEDRVLLHGAGSFGHFHARQYALKHGSSHPKYLPIGFAQTRSSVTRLNGLVVSALLAHGLPAVSVHPFPQWRKRRNVMRRGAATCADVVRCWRAGLLPVLHGDAVFDGVPRAQLKFNSHRPNLQLTRARPTAPCRQRRRAWPS